jgi:hypothetical protein
MGLTFEHVLAAIS